MELLGAAIIMGTNDSLYLGGGWHALQAGPGGVQSRWMGPCADFRLAFGARPSAVRVLVLGGGDRPSYGLSLFAQEQRVYHLPNALQGEGWNLVDLNVPAQADGGGSWLSLRTEIRDGLADFRSAGFIPHHVLGNGDYRQLGALVGAIRIID